MDGVGEAPGEEFAPFASIVEVGRAVAFAGDEIAASAEGLPADVVEAAKDRGRARDLWETGQELLEELENQGWKSKALDRN